MLKKLLALGDSPWRWVAGAEAALAVALPTTGFVLAGHASEGLIGSLGAFTALHFTKSPARTRAAALPFVIAGLVIASATGVVCSGSPALILTGLVATAAAASLLTQGFATGPPGALMFVLVAGVSGHLADRVPNPALIPLWVGITAVASYLIVLAPSVPGLYRNSHTGSGQLAHTPITWTLDNAKLKIAARLTLAAAAAGVLTAVLGMDRMYWAVASAIAVLQTRNPRGPVLLRATHRVLGSVLGVGVFAGLYLLHPTGVGLVGILAALQGIGEVVVVRNYGLALALLTPIALLISSSAHTATPYSIVSYRLIDTLLGCAIAVVIWWATREADTPRGVDRARSVQ
jgi:Fusaric acid resistance protein-like